MRVLLLNVPHPSIGSRVPDEHLPPLGLLSVGGSLRDSGHDVRLLDCELGPLSEVEILRRLKALEPEALLLGHSGSTSGHPVVARITALAREVLPQARIVYGGVHPTYHWQEILREEAQIDVIVRGEAEETAPKLIGALERCDPLDDIPGLAFRRDGEPHATAAAPTIDDLEAHPVGWDLVDLSRYSYWGNRRAVVVQFSRGCPHKCSYCGQRGFWRRWRHRDPERFAAELAWLHRAQGVEVFNLADENPTASREAWLAFLKALIAQDVEVTIVGSTRADDIVRDADILPLYRRAGVKRWLLGVESCDEATLARVKKGGSTARDRQAIALLRQQGIISMATWVVGFEQERGRDYLRGLRQLLSYDPDQIQLVYATPHRWTPYYRQEAGRRVIQTDRRCWDYKHQVLATRHLPAWQVLAWVKLIEATMQLRPRALARLLAHPERSFREAQRWYYRIGRKVWFREIFNFIFRDQHLAEGPTLEQLWGPPQDQEVEVRPPRGEVRGDPLRCHQESPPSRPGEPPKSDLPPSAWSLDAGCSPSEVGPPAPID